MTTWADDFPDSPEGARQVDRRRRLLEVRCPHEGCLLLLVESLDDGRRYWRPLDLSVTDDGRRMDLTAGTVTDADALPPPLRVRCRCLYAEGDPAEDSHTRGRLSLDAGLVAAALAGFRPGRRNVVGVASVTLHHI